MPVLFRVTVCAALVVPTAWLLKVRLVGERLTTVAVPVPLRLTVCGLPLALSAIFSEAPRLPLAEGVKVTLMVQLPAAATELPQVLVWAKSPALVPASAMLVMLSAALPVLFRVTVCAALDDPSGWLLKARLVLLRETSGVGVRTAAVLPPPPQEVDKTASAKQAVARVAAFAPS